MKSRDLFRVLPTTTTQTIARSGGWGLYETVITLEKASTEDASERYITVLSPELLPPPTQDGYISFEDAQRQMRISRSELTRLCQNGTIVAKKANGNWLIQTKSLEEYKRS
jgi:predicted alpha/beta hydrolase family esterase